MEITASILNISIQNPPGECFSSLDLKWILLGNKEHYEEVALVPYDQVSKFITGESSFPEFPTQFHCEKICNRESNSLKHYKNDEYLEYKRYWCSFGPENYQEFEGVSSFRRFRLNTRNRVARPESLRGCTCNFIVKRLYARPSVALIIYNNRRKHVNKYGKVCHGPLDGKAFSGGAKKSLYLSDEIKQQTISMFYLGYSAERVLQKQMVKIRSYCGGKSNIDRFASKFVEDIGRTINRLTHELDLDDQKSIQSWIAKNPDDIFFKQHTSETDAFILGIQTKWQLQQMLHFGYQSLMAIDSTFGKKKLKYPIGTLLVFDSEHQAIPVAWVVTQSFTKQDVFKWMKALVDRARMHVSNWKIIGCLIDDPTFEVDPIREVFNCPVLFCIWRIRKAWLKNIVKKCNNTKVQREIFKRLGQIIYDVLGGADSANLISEFVQDFVDQTEFIRYFRASWLPRISMWFSYMRKCPLASQDACSAIEAYHMNLKHVVNDDSHLNLLHRVDWLVHQLTTKMLARYIIYRIEGSNSECILPTAWQQAEQIPDASIAMTDKHHHSAKVEDHIVWNPGSEFAFCDCQYSMLGNLCKHVIKVNIVFHDRHSYEASLAFHSFKEIISSSWKNPVEDSISFDLSLACIAKKYESIQSLTELCKSRDVKIVIDKFWSNWVGKRYRTFFGKPSSRLALPSTSLKACQKMRRRRKVCLIDL